MNISAIIPCRNQGDTLERAIRSAFNAGCTDVYVYDDGSTDSTEYVMRKLSYNRLECYTGISRIGASAARNILVENAPDGFLICLDADDELRDITVLLNAYEPNMFVYGNHDEICGDSITHHKGAAIKTLPNKLVSGVTFLFHMDDWYGTGFDPDFAVCEDWAFMCALVNAGVQGKYVDTTVYNRYLKPEGNERTALARDYWTFYRTMARRKYPAVFAGTT